MQRPGLFCLWFVVLLAGCVSQKNTSAPDGRRLAELASWTAQGKMAYDLNGQRGNFSYRWAQSNDAYEIALFGPLGISVANITGNEISAKIETAEGQALSAPSPEQLLRQTLGLDMPVSLMVHWLKGVPQNEIALDKLKESAKSGRNNFNERGWQVEVQRRDKSMNPSRIRISKAGANLLVIVKDWSY